MARGINIVSMPLATTHTAQHDTHIHIRKRRVQSSIYARGQELFAQYRTIPAELKKYGNVALCMLHTRWFMKTPNVKVMNITVLFTAVCGVVGQVNWPMLSRMRRTLIILPCASR